jgi:predicted regulator of Ras-like GTPase activity (Roadblock/LC7/MglB family)
VATKFKPILEKLVRDASLEGAILLSADGLPIDSVLPVGSSEERLAAMSAVFLSFLLSSSNILFTLKIIKNSKIVKINTLTNKNQSNQTLRNIFF